MANSKAIIHPIQLQGAELNLNKYDAEIKQYSGFNKNNAPFVGGCLANVFTKDTQMENSGVYINKNGDVWSIDEYGFLKNSEPFGKRSETPLEFWDVKPYSMPEDNIIAYYNNEVYVTKKYIGDNSIYTIRIKDKTLELNFGSDVYFESFDIEYAISCYVVGYKYYKYNSSAYATDVTYGAYFRWDDTEITDTDIKPLYLNSTGDEVFGGTIQCEWVNYSDVCLSTYGSDWVLFAINEASNLFWGNSYESGHAYLIYFRSLYPNLELYVYKDCTVFQGYANLFFNVNNYHFTKKYAYLVGLAYMSGSSSYFVNNQIDLYTRLTPELNGNGLYFSERKDKIILFAHTGSGNGYVYQNKYNVDKSVFKKYGAHYCIDNHGADSGTPYKKSMVGVCDFLSEAITVETKETNMSLVSFETGGVVNNSVLVNNGIVSGIALPGALILATDWNSVDKDNIFFSAHFGEENNIDDNFVLYKNTIDNKWYKLYRTTEKKLVYKNGQIIANFNALNNSVKLATEKQLTFASAWNNRFPFCNNYQQDYSNYNNNYYFASAINEYDMQDNPSLLLNPIPVVSVTSGLTDKQLFSKLRSGSGVDFFRGTTESGECKYYFSAVNDKDISVIFLNEELLTDILVYNNIYNNYNSLPYPTDTNGNVQYSPSLFSEIKDSFGNKIFIKSGNIMYPLIIGNNSEPIMAFYLASGIDNLDEGFIVQGQFYGIINNGIYSLQYSNGVVSDISFIVDCSGLQFCGSTPYEALFFSPTNRCLYSFVGANVLNPKQFVDKISQVTMYKYNPATQSIFLVTDIGVIVTSLFGIYQIDMLGVTQIYLLDNGVVLADDNGNYRYIKYYKENGDGYNKENIELETCFYGSDNQTVTINDCLYMRLFSEEMESGDVEVSATTISNLGRVTEKTTFKIKKEDWDKETNSIYLRYQPKEQRGLGVSFKIESPFKIASLSVGSQPDAILVDKVSKGAVNAPYNNNSSITEW